MTYRFDGYNWLVRLEKGELLIKQLETIVKQQKIGGAWISGLGACMWAEIGSYDLTKKLYNWKKLDEPLEIIGLQGNIAWTADQPILHIHGSFSNDQMQAFGGHVKELEVAGTCEILLHRWYGEALKRSQDPTTGLNLLNL